MATKIYGWFYDKAGNKRIVNAPVQATTVQHTIGRNNGNFKSVTVNQTVLTPVRKHTRTLTGKIPDSVGYPGFPSGIHTT